MAIGVDDLGKIIGPLGDLKDLLQKLLSSEDDKKKAEVNTFIEIDGIDGESDQKGQDKKIEVLDFHWGVTQPRSASASAQTAERAHFGDLTIYKLMGKASPGLAHACASGKRLKKAKLEIRLPRGKDNIRLLHSEYELFDVIITSDRTGSRGFGEGIFLEEVSLSYNKITWRHLKKDVKDNTQSADAERAWDLKTNK